MQRIVVGVDPSGAAKKSSDESGIIVAGKALCSCKGKPEPHVFVMEDVSGKMNPDEMARTAIAAYRRWKADRIVAEDNFGGEYVRSVIHLTDKAVAFKAVHASRGKVIRAEPIAALYEQGRVHHVGYLPRLENQLCTFDPATYKGSPDRLDACVWAITDLMLGPGTPGHTDTGERGERRI
jgi:predicted phage terminase large subunit-like protein